MKHVWLMSLILLASCDDAPSVRRQNNERARENVETISGVRSQLHRVRGTTVLATTGEIAAAANLPVGYSDIPRIEESDDGLGSSPVVRSVRPGVVCGTGSEFTSYRARMTDCAEKNPQHSSWNGTANGNAGEGIWRLIVRESNGREAWVDESTGLIWSDVISSVSNWCQASGNIEGELAENGIDCNDLSQGISRCDGAALMGVPAADIAWRLPTRGDYLQADLNGLRFVLPRTDAAVWTATVSGTNRENAWSIIPQTGVLSSSVRSTALSVRCVGRRLK